MNEAIYLDKGCFLGQEPLSRMYHRGKPRKFIAIANLPPGSEGADQIYIDRNLENSVGKVSDPPHGTLGFVELKWNTDISKEFFTDKGSFTIISKSGYYPKITR